MHLMLTLAVRGETRILRSVHATWEHAIKEALLHGRISHHKFTVVKSPNGTGNWLVVH